jgi:hypothetical protein
VREESAGDRLESTRWALLAQAEQTMIVPPRFAAYPRCEDAIWRAVQQAMIGIWSPREAVTRAAHEIRGLM